MPECDYSQLHQLWVRSPCGPQDLWQRQRAAKLEFDRHQVNAYETSRVVCDPEHRILRRIIAACDGYDRVYATQAKYGLSYTEEEVVAVCLEVETDARIDRQMKPFIERFGRALMCPCIDRSIYLAIHLSIYLSICRSIHRPI